MFKSIDNVYEYILAHTVEDISELISQTKNKQERLFYIEIRRIMEKLCEIQQIEQTKNKQE